MLIEAAAALAIFTLALHFAWPATGTGTTTPRFLSLVAASAALLRDARTTAIVTDREVAAQFDSTRRRLSAAGLVVDLPADVAVTLTAGGNCPAGEGAAAILFRPDGSNCGGVLRFRRGARIVRTLVNWADGHVDVREGG